MADINPFDAFGTVTNSLTGLTNSIYGIVSAERGYKDARKDIQWQQNMAEAQWLYKQEHDKLLMEREDNAIQRRVADAKAAGFSPLAALGQQSATSVISNTGNPAIPAAVSPQGSAASAIDAMSSFAHENNVLFNAIAERSSKKELKEMETQNALDVAVTNATAAMERLVVQGVIDKDIAEKHYLGVLKQVDASLDINNKTLSFQAVTKTLENIPSDSKGRKNVVVVKDDEIADVRAYYDAEMCAMFEYASQHSVSASEGSTVAVGAKFDSGPVGAGSNITDGSFKSTDTSKKVGYDIDAWFSDNPFPVSASEYKRLNRAGIEVFAHDATSGYGDFNSKNTKGRFHPPYEAWKRERHLQK